MTTAFLRMAGRISKISVCVCWGGRGREWSGVRIGGGGTGKALAVDQKFQNFR